MDVARRKPDCAFVCGPQEIGFAKLTPTAQSAAGRLWTYDVQWPAVRKTVGAINVPEHSGNIWPSLFRLMTNAPTFAYVFEISNCPLTIRDGSPGDIGRT